MSYYEKSASFLILFSCFSCIVSLAFFGKVVYRRYYPKRPDTALIDAICVDYVLMILVAWSTSFYSVCILLFCFDSDFTYLSSCFTMLTFSSDYIFGFCSPFVYFFMEAENTTCLGCRGVYGKFASAFYSGLLVFSFLVVISIVILWIQEVVVTIYTIFSLWAFVLEIFTLIFVFKVWSPGVNRVIQYGTYLVKNNNPSRLTEEIDCLQAEIETLNRKSQQFEEQNQFEKICPFSPSSLTTSISTSHLLKKTKTKINLKNKNIEQNLYLETSPMPSTKPINQLFEKSTISSSTNFESFKTSTRKSLLLFEKTTTSTSTVSYEGNKGEKENFKKTTIYGQNKKKKKESGEKSNPRLANSLKLQPKNLPLQKDNLKIKKDHDHDGDENFSAMTTTKKSTTTHFQKLSLKQKITPNKLSNAPVYRRQRSASTASFFSTQFLSQSSASAVDSSINSGNPSHNCLKKKKNILMKHIIVPSSNFMYDSPSSRPCSAPSSPIRNKWQEKLKITKLKLKEVNENKSSKWTFIKIILGSCINHAVHLLPFYLYALLFFTSCCDFEIFQSLHSTFLLSYIMIIIFNGFETIFPFVPDDQFILLNHAVFYMLIVRFIPVIITTFNLDNVHQPSPAQLMFRYCWLLYLFPWRQCIPFGNWCFKKIF